MRKIRDVLGQGGELPSGEGSMERPVTGGEKDEFSDELKQYRKELIKTQIAKDMARGDREPARDDKSFSEAFQKEIEKIRQEIAPMTKFVELYSKDQEKVQLYSSIVSPLKERLESVEKWLEQANQKEAPSPVDTIREVRGILTETADMLKEKLQVPQQPATPMPNDIPGLLQIEERRMEREDRQRQHEKEMAILKQQHEEKMAMQKREDERSDARWEADFRLKRQESEDSRRGRGVATDAIIDMAGSIGDAVKTERTSEKVSGQPDIRIPKRFKCSECGEMVDIPENHDINQPISCGKCGAEYKFSEVQTP